MESETYIYRSIFRFEVFRCFRRRDIRLGIRLEPSLDKKS